MHISCVCAFEFVSVKCLCATLDMHKHTCAYMNLDGLFVHQPAASCLSVSFCRSCVWRGVCA